MTMSKPQQDFFISLSHVMFQKTSLTLKIWQLCSCNAFIACVWIKCEKLTHPDTSYEFALESQLEVCPWYAWTRKNSKGYNSFLTTTKAFKNRFLRHAHRVQDLYSTYYDFLAVFSLSVKICIPPNSWTSTTLIIHNDHLIPIPLSTL